VAGRFPLYTDADTHGPVVEGLRQRGWDILRAIDRFPERTSGLTHFEEAARLGRVLISLPEADGSRQHDDRPGTETL
jgi:hypothetical protein